VGTDIQEVGECVMDSSGSGYGTAEHSCEQRNEPLGYIKMKDISGVTK
jgi:hypothetical protein